MQKVAMKRASIGFALILSGFLAGLVLTGRLRSADDTIAQPVQRPSAAVSIPTSSSLPDLSAVAAQAVKGVVTVYVCQNFACKAPFIGAEAVEQHFR